MTNRRAAEQLMQEAGLCDDCWLDVINSITAALDAKDAEIARLREALTPSGDTKAAYHGEFEFAEDTMDDGARGPVWRTVPWTTIKEIMAAILARAERPAP